jgi:hypothetical protein
VSFASARFAKYANFADTAIGNRNKDYDRRYCVNGGYLFYVKDGGIYAVEEENLVEKMVMCCDTAPLVELSICVTNRGFLLVSERRDEVATIRIKLIGFDGEELEKYKLHSIPADCKIQAVCAYENCVFVCILSQFGANKLKRYDLNTGEHTVVREYDSGEIRSIYVDAEYCYYSEPGDDSVFNRYHFESASTETWHMDGSVIKIDEKYVWQINGSDGVLFAVHPNYEKNHLRFFIEDAGFPINQLFVDSENCYFFSTFFERRGMESTEALLHSESQPFAQGVKGISAGWSLLTGRYVYVELGKNSGVYQYPKQFSSFFGNPKDNYQARAVPK